MIHNSIIFEQTQEDSLTDPLTGLPNTRFMFLHLSRELARAERMTHRSGAAGDGPRQLQGHQRHLRPQRRRPRAARGGADLRAGIRPYDICIRYAGDEFVVVLAGCGADEAERKRLELQRAVEDLVFEPRPGGGCRSASASARRSSRRTATATKRIMATADSRMYRDKTLRKQRDAGAARGHRHRRPDQRRDRAAATGRSGRLRGRHPARRLRRAVAAGQLQVRGDRAAHHSVRARRDSCHAAHAAPAHRDAGERLPLPRRTGRDGRAPRLTLRKPYSIASAPSETARTGNIELLVQVDDSGGPDPHLERRRRARGSTSRVRSAASRCRRWKTSRPC